MVSGEGGSMILAWLARRSFGRRRWRCRVGKDGWMCLPLNRVMGWCGIRAGIRRQGARVLMVLNGEIGSRLADFRSRLLRARVVRPLE